MWIETASIAGGASGTSPLVRYDEIIAVVEEAPEDASTDWDHPGWVRCWLRLRDGTWVPCKGSIQIIRERLRKADQDEQAIRLQELGYQKRLRLNLGG